MVLAGLEQRLEESKQRHLEAIAQLRRERDLALGEVRRLTIEVEDLRRENEALRGGATE